MDERCCAHCIFALVLRNAAPGTLVCVSRPEALGEPTQVALCDCCPRFEPKPAPGDRPAELPPPPDEQTALIPLTQNKAALVDRADLEGLSQYKWYAARIGRRFYACRQEKGRTILMHRQIMQAPPGMVVDHRKFNTLDNRRKYLRTCTQAQNRQNSRSRGSKSGLLGVYPQGDKWYGVVAHQGRQHYAGTFLEPAEAARARDRLAFQLFGEFAFLNFPDDLHIVYLKGTIHLHVTIKARLTIERRKKQKRGSV